MRRLTAPLALAFVSLLAACGGSAKSPVSLAAAKSAHAKSLHVVTLLQEQVGQAASIQLNLDGDFDNVHKRSSLILDLGGLARGVGDTGASSQLFDGRELSDSSSGSSVFYLDLPFYSQSIPAAKEWLRFDAAAIAPDDEVGILEISELNSTGPQAQLQILEKSSATFANLGQDDINGTLATHFQGKVDLEKVVGKLSGPAKSDVETLLAHSNGAIVPYNVWIGPSGYLDRVEMQLAGSAGTQGLTLGLISDFSNYGSPVHIDLPPADRVTSLTHAGMATLTSVLESK